MRRFGRVRRQGVGRHGAAELLLDADHGDVRQVRRRRRPPARRGPRGRAAWRSCRAARGRPASRPRPLPVGLARQHLAFERHQLVAHEPRHEVLEHPVLFGELEIQPPSPPPPWLFALLARHSRGTRRRASCPKASGRKQSWRRRAELAREATGPLKGVRILDMTSVVFGAYATQMLGDLGADVIKVEFPGGRRGGGGDIMRWTGALPEGCPPDLGPIFLTINRNKRSVLLDLREAKAAPPAAAADQDLRRVRRLGALRGPEAPRPRLRGRQGDRARTSSTATAPAMARTGPTPASRPTTT